MKTQQVLIIEDDRDTAGFFRTVLELVGFECEVLLSAREALGRLAMSAPDLILLDIRLGVEVNGEDILYQVRSNPRFDKTRVVVITAYPRLAEPITNLADLVLVKPVEIDQLKNLMIRLGGLDFKSKYQLFRDPVTELLNEEFFLTRLELAFERTRRHPEFQFAIILVDCQLAAPQEPQVPPDAVLAILREIGCRLRKFIRPTDAVARLSGWRFVSLHEDLKGPEEIQVIVKRLGEKLAAPYGTDDGSFQVKFEMIPVVHDSSRRQPVDILNAALKALADAGTAG